MSTDRKEDIERFLRDVQHHEMQVLRDVEIELQALRSQIGQGVPDGWQLVPKEPTIGMLVAGGQYRVSTEHPNAQHAIYAAMLASAPPAPQQKPLTDEQDRALCEAYCNAASDEYFKARPQLDSDVNRRIFCAGHRKAWIEWQAAHNIGEKK